MWASSSRTRHLEWSRQDCSTMPRRARHRSSPWSGSTPRTETSPAERLRNPSRISIVVVFPAPFGPSSATTSPCSRVKVSPSSTSLSPYRIRRSVTSMTAIALLRFFRCCSASVPTGYCSTPGRPGPLFHPAPPRATVPPATAPGYCSTPSAAFRDSWPPERCLPRQKSGLRRTTQRSARRGPHDPAFAPGEPYNSAFGRSGGQTQRRAAHILLSVLLAERGGSPPHTGHEQHHCPGDSPPCHGQAEVAAEGATHRVHNMPGGHEVAGTLQPLRADGHRQQDSREQQHRHHHHVQHRCHDVFALGGQGQGV